MTDPLPSLTADLRQLVDSQTPHPCFPALEVLWDAPITEAGCSVMVKGVVQFFTPQRFDDFIAGREELIRLAEADHYNHGVVYESWDRAMWEICRLRVANPELPVSFMVGGANGSGKTRFAAWLVIQAMMQVRDKDRPFLCLSMDEPNSETVQQAALYHYLPNEFKTEGGGVKTRAHQKLKYNASGGFTDNRFSFDHGASMQCRFWSKDIKTMEGPRWYMAWSDEGIPLNWFQSADKRLISTALNTPRHIPMWKQLLEAKAKDPSLKFPREKIGLLCMALHLITYTAKDGYTPLVAHFMEPGKVMRRVEADRELLPRRDDKGTVIGGELLPNLIHSMDKTCRMLFMYAWDNPLGGNWRALREKAKLKPKAEIKWWLYGVAEKTADTPFPNFDEQAHCRPLSWIKGARGTWWHSCDPTASGGKTWVQIWALVLAQQHGHMAAGDIFIAREYPQRNDHIPGHGDLGEWALPGGKDNIGVAGPAQRTLPVGFKFRADEIRRVERELARSQGEPWAEDPERMKWFIGGLRIMDCHVANTEVAGKAESRTMIDWMADFQLLFEGSGKDAGAPEGGTLLKPGLQAINDRFNRNRELEKLDEATGWLVTDPREGPGPKLWICDECTNLIASLQNYNGMKGPWDDYIDVLRYLVITNPRHVSTRAGGIRPNNTRLS